MFFGERPPVTPKESRLLLGLTLAECSARTGLSIDQHRRFERHAYGVGESAQAELQAFYLSLWDQLRTAAGVVAELAHAQLA